MFTVRHADKSETRNVYAVWTNTDLTEGRGREYVQYFTEKRSTANRLAKRNYVMGTDSRVTTETQILWDKRWYTPYVQVIEPSAQDLKEEAILEAQERAATAKEKALARARELGLSDKEIAALRG